MAEYKSSSIDKVQYQGLEIQKIYVGSELFWPIAEGSGGSDPGENPVVDIVLLNYDVNKIPASGGTVSKLNSYTVQVVYKNGNKVEYTDESYITYTNSVSAPSSTNQTEHKVGSLEFTFTCPDIEQTKNFSVDVYQIAYVKSITGLEIVSFTADEVPWQGGAVVPHLEYLVTYSDGSTSNSDDSLVIEITGTTEVPMNPNITRSEWSMHVWVVSYEYSLQEEKYAYFYQAAVPAKSINLNSYDVDNIPAEGGTISTLNSYYVAVEYMNNKTYFYTSKDRITYKNSVTAGASTNEEEHLVGYLQFTFTCPYIDSSLDFSVQVYQDAYVAPVETRLAYMTMRSDSGHTYKLKTESGQYFTLKDLLSGEGNLFIGFGYTKDPADNNYSYMPMAISTEGEEFFICMDRDSYGRYVYWQIYDKNSKKTVKTSAASGNSKFEQIMLISWPFNGNTLISTLNNYTNSLSDWTVLSINYNSTTPIVLYADASIYYIQIGDRDSSKVLVPYYRSDGQYYFKDISTGTKYFVEAIPEYGSTWTSNISPVTYDRLTISVPTETYWTPTINKIPYTGGTFESTIDSNTIKAKINIDSEYYTITDLNPYYDPVDLLITGTCSLNDNETERNVGTQRVTYKLFSCTGEPKTDVLTYTMTLEAHPARASYMTNYNLCYAVWQELYEGLSITINGDGSNVHPKKAPDTYAIPLDISDSNDTKLMNGGMVMAVVQDAYTSDTLTKNQLYYYNSGLYKDKMYRNYNSYVYYFENPSYYLSIIANGTKYNLSGWHNGSVSNKLQYEWKFDATKKQTASDVLSNCPWTNIFLWCESVNGGSGSSTITCKVMPGFEYYHGSTYVTQIKLYIYPTRLEIWEADDKGVGYVSALKSWTLSSSYSYFITLAVPVKPTVITSIPIHFKFPERGIMWIGTPE